MVVKYWLSNRFGLIPIKQEDAIAFAEVVLYRALMCPQCTASGKCIGTGEEGSGCGCEVNGLYSSMDATCDIGSWGAYNNENFAAQWRLYKAIEHIKFKVERNDI